MMTCRRPKGENSILTPHCRHAQPRGAHNEEDGICPEWHEWQAPLRERVARGRPMAASGADPAGNRRSSNWNVDVPATTSGPSNFGSQTKQWSFGTALRIVSTCVVMTDV